jgi:hypothetical protein
MRIVYESSDPYREGKRVEQAHKLERRAKRRAKSAWQNLCITRVAENV